MREAPSQRRHSVLARWVVQALAGALLAALCVSMTSASTIATAAKIPATGCGTPTPGTTTLSVIVSGHARSVLVHVPLKQGDSSPLALVLNLHGTGSNALQEEEFSGMNYASDADDYIVAYPQAIIPEGSGFQWNVPGVPLYNGSPVPAKAASDIKFLTKLVGVLEVKYCVDRAAVYATGFSGGAREASQLACDDSTIFAAVAPVSGLRRPTPCPAKRAVPLISFHGSADKVDPFGGHGQAYWTYSVPTAAKEWAGQDHCDKRAQKSTLSSGATLTVYAGCANRADVALYEVRGEGHEWPGGPLMPSSITSLLGPQSNAVNADALMWTFFEQHRLS